MGMGDYRKDKTGTQRRGHTPQADRSQVSAKVKVTLHAS